MKNLPTLFFFGHHKAGSTYIMNVMKNICYYAGLKHDHYHTPFQFGYNLSKFIQKENLDFVSYLSADYQYLSKIEDYKGFHVIRDPRDIAISAYFSHLKSHPTDDWPELIEHRKELASLPKDEGLLLSFRFTEILQVNGHNLNLFASLTNWNYDDPKIQEIKFEDLIINPYDHFLRILKHLNLMDDYQINIPNILKFLINNLIKAKKKAINRKYKIPFWLLADIIHHNNFQELSKGRKPGLENINNHYRKGISGDWKNHFKKEHKTYFKEQWGDFIIWRDYEKDYDW